MNIAVDTRIVSSLQQSRPFKYPVMAVYYGDIFVRLMNKLHEKQVLTRNK